MGGGAMKKKLLALLLILLALAMVAALVNSAEATTGGGSGGGTGGGAGGSSGGSSGDSSATYSWIDPQTGFDIFDYPNVLTLAEGQDCEILVDGSVFEGGSAILHADGSVDLPASIETLDSFTVSLGSYVLDNSCKYYFYYAREYDGDYDRCGLGCEDMTDGRFDIDFSVEGDGTVYEFGCWEPYNYDATNVYVTLNVLQGLVGTSNSVNSGRFYLRVIAVPR